MPFQSINTGSIWDEWLVKKTKNVVSEGVKLWRTSQVQDNKNFTFSKTSAFRQSRLYVVNGKK